MSGWVGHPDMPQSQPFNFQVGEPAPSLDDRFMFRQAVVITFMNPEDGWNAVFIEGPEGEHQDEYFRDRDEAITWARERCDVVRVQIQGTSEYLNV